MRSKIPNIPKSIILTTSKEMNNFENVDRVKYKILSYVKNDDFKQYIVKVLAVKKIGYHFYSEIIFSIDPGTKYLGLVIFLDDYYLNSHTIFKKDSFIEIIKMYVNALQETNQNPLKLVFKFGRGIMPITMNLIEQIFKNFTRENLRVLLIDEARTSKYKIRDENRKRIPKDEAAALFISLRDGYEITNETYKYVLNQKKKKNMIKNEGNPTGNNDEIDNRLIQIAENVLKGSISLSKSIELLKTENFNYHSI